MVSVGMAGFANGSKLGMCMGRRIRGGDAQTNVGSRHEWLMSLWENECTVMDLHGKWAAGLEEWLGNMKNVWGRF